MHQQQITYKDSVINYHVFGGGTEVLFCFHGYGEDGASFAFLEQKLRFEYTLYAIDFPIHGSTQWDEKEAFTINDLFSIIQLIEPDQTKKFSLLAYSMGGRAAMHLLERFPEKINCVALVAPDGLHQNIWYRLTTQTASGNRIFHFTMNNPRWLFFLVHVNGKLTIINKSIVKFIHYYLDDKDERALLYRRWTNLRKIKPDLKKIKRICPEKNIQLNFLFGKYDRIILSRRADIFKNTKNIHIKIINAGHQLLKEKYADEIMALLNH
jgi:pimeloyl-ACP methyl ester carboxylesterase